MHTYTGRHYYVGTKNYNYDTSYRRQKVASYQLQVQNRYAAKSQLLLLFIVEAEHVDTKELLSGQRANPISDIEFGQG